MAILDLEEVREAITHDKKASGQNCSVVYVSEIGNGSIKESIEYEWKYCDDQKSDCTNKDNIIYKDFN